MVPILIISDTTKQNTHGCFFSHPTGHLFRLWWPERICDDLSQFHALSRLRGRRQGLTGMCGVLPSSILIFLPDAIRFYSPSNRLEVAVFIIPYSKLRAAL
jgi:hypothetical protein